MVRKLVLSLIAILGAGALFVGAQNRQISGTVANPEGQPIVGATVVVDGTSAGTTTGSNGKFTLTAPADATLTVSFIGYQSQQIPVAGKTWLDIELKEDSQSIDDVIVVAYGTTKKEAFTGSASVIKTDDIAKRQVSNVTNALSGVTSGVQVTSTNGQPGTDATVRIRGIGSFSASNKPLYVVDGVPYDGQISSINTADIESLTVLKDAAASAIYGARGANGVILITTKRGKSSEAVITVDAKWGSNSRAVPQYDVITDLGQYMELVGQSMSTYAQLLRGFTPEQAAQYIEKNVYTNSAGGVGYRVFDYPEGETLIGADGKLNPNATLGYVNGDYLFLPDNWYDELFDKGNLRQEYNVSISGNSDKINYYASLGYLDDSGIMSNSGFTRYSTRLKADYQAKKWLKFGANVSYSNVENNNPTNQTSSGSSANIFYLTGMIAPIYPLYIRNAEGSVAKDSHGYTMYDFGDTSTGMPYKRTFMSGSNPASMWELDKATYTYDDFSSRYYATVDIYKGLKFTYNLGIDLSAYRYQRLYNPYYGQYSKVGGVIYVANKRELALNQQQLLNYSGTFADKHNIDILVGHETYKWKRSYLQGGREKIFNPNVVELNNAISQQSNDSYTDNYFTEGYFAQVNYDFDGKYFISGSYRRDASSRFHKDHRWGDFGSVGASWILSKENFLSGAEWLDLLKIKASYGVQGNDNLLYQTGETNYYPYADQYTLSQLDGSFATALSYKGNKDITWETSHSINAGVEFSFWQGRLAGNVEYFNRRTSDMLYYMPSPNSIGYAYYPTNVGSARNSGVEIDLNSTVFRTKNVTWTLNANLTYLKNKIIKLDESLGGEWIDGSRIYREGESMYQLYLRKYAGVNENGQSTWYLADGSATTEYAQADRFTTGDILPKVYGGFGTTLEFFGIDFSIAFAYQLGGKVYDNTYASLMHAGTAQTAGSNWHKDILRAWKIGDEAGSTDVPRLYTSDTNTNSMSDRFLISSNYLDITNITLGYTLPSSWTRKVHISKLRLYMAADNVALFTKRQGLDPRQSYTAAGSYRYAPIRTISGGINLTF